jgi:deoxyxylulose-5-phosphate synthase
MGFYVGPVDGYDLENLIPILEKLRDSTSNKPVLLHLKTTKGYGYPPAEEASDRMRCLQVQPRNWRPGQGGALQRIFNFDLCELFD